MFTHVILGLCAARSGATVIPATQAATVQSHDEREIVFVLHFGIRDATYLPGRVRAQAPKTLELLKQRCAQELCATSRAASI
jgi:hypothetical protein